MINWATTGSFTPTAITITPRFSRWEKQRNQIVLSTETTNGDAETPYNIVVTAEAIQAQGAAVQWSRVESMTVAEIAVWFTSQTQIAYGA